jgi:hypothetical protein
MKSIFYFLFVISWQLHAQVEFLDTETTISTPFQLPIRLGKSGVSFLQTPDNIMVGPAFGFAIAGDKTLYNLPVKMNESRGLVSQVRGDSFWMQIRKHRYDGGLGVAVLMGSYTNFALIPFKGAKQQIIRMKTSRDEVVDMSLAIPTNFKELELWRVGDQGTYQTYGGVEALMAAGVSIVNLAREAVSFQNQFIISIRKISEKNVLFSIAEEKLKRSETTIGPLVSKASLFLFRGHRFGSEFVLDLTNPQHSSLFEAGLQGRISQLQMALQSRDQKITWTGYDRSFYLGVPYFIGVNNGHGSYSMTNNGMAASMDVSSRQSTGVLSTVGEHNRLVYRTDEVILLFWTSEMKKAKKHVMDKYFFDNGTAIGLKGFSEPRPEGMYGSVLTQIGLTFTKEEVESMKSISVETLGNNLQVQCQKLNLSCAQESKVRSLMNKYQKILLKPWNDLGIELGRLMIEHPALIQSILKSMKSKKQGYIKFLNDNYQSVEGMVSIEI